MVKDLIKTTTKNIKIYNIQNLKDVYQSKKKIVTFSNKMKIFDKTIKKFLKNKMYYHIDVKKKTSHGKNVVKTLFHMIKKNPKNYININKYTHFKIERVICDYIAGMTDRYAINLYKKIK